MGKTRVIAETGAGQHGVATATACALLGLDCVVYMGAVDTARQALNVARMRLLGAEVVSVETGSQTLKDAINEAFRDWVTNADNTYYCFGTAAGPASVPDHGARLSANHRPGDARADPGSGGPVARRGHGLRRRRIQRHRDLPRLHRRSGRAAGRIRGGGRRRRDRQARSDIHRRFTRGLPGIVLLPAAGRGRPDHRIPFDLSGSGLSGRGPRTRLAQGNRACRIPARSPTPRRWMRSACCAARKASSRPSNPRTRWPAPSSWASRLGRGAVIVVNLSGRGDKDVETAAKWFGLLEPGEQ